MSQIINEIAKIDISNDIIKHLDVEGISNNFRKNFHKLDNLKDFREEYEKQNFLKRWWHNDKLRDAQLDSIEVQAEFSKTIGQLMVINMLQSKKLVEQQMQLNDQQEKLKTQADGIAEHADELQKQHQILANQSTKLEKLVHEYFELKGLTEDGAQKLIEIAVDIKKTKDDMLQKLAVHAKELENKRNELATHMESLAKQVNEQVRLSVEQNQSEIALLKQETREALLASESALRIESELAQQISNQNLSAMKQSLCDTEATLLAKSNQFCAVLATKLDEQEAAQQEKLQAIGDGLLAQSLQISGIASGLADQKTYQEGLARFQQEYSARLKRLSLIVGIIATSMAVILGGLGHWLNIF